MLERLGRILYRWFEEPATRGIPLDDPRLTRIRLELSRTKPALHLAYRAWYRELAVIDALAPEGVRIEFGSGGGFLEEFVPNLVRTDLLDLPHLDVRCSAEKVPFLAESAGALYLVNVLHHVSNPERFLSEAMRVLKPGGILAMIEPFVTPFSSFLYRHFHPEPFDPKAPDWYLAPSGPLSGGNDALPWILFVRDRERLERRFPEMETVKIRRHTFLTHLLGGGVMLRSLLPGSWFPTLHRIESMAGRIYLPLTALFATIVVRKRS